MRPDGVDFILYIYIVICTHAHTVYTQTEVLYTYMCRYFLSVFCPKFNPAFKCVAHTRLPQIPVTVHMSISGIKLVNLEHLRQEAQLHFWYYLTFNFYLLYMNIDDPKQNFKKAQGFFGFLNKHFQDLHQYIGFHILQNIHSTMSCTSTGQGVGVEGVYGFTLESKLLHTHSWTAS